MSTQLILYPQYYNGFNPTVTSVFNEYLVNRVNFTGLNSTTLHNTTSVTPSQDAILNSPPSILGNWYRFTTTGSPWGNVTAPAVTSNNLVLSQDGATTGHTGVYQQLSGLIVGNTYKLRINISTQSADGVITVETYSGLGSSATINPPSSDYITNVVQISHFFTAQSTNDTVLINFALYGTSGNLTISSMSITETATSPTLVYSDLNDGQVICDLYQEEDIPLTLSIDDFKNVAEQVKSYSKDFNLPATKRNNQIFNNMFEITRSSDNSTIFNPYVRTQCVLKQDGFILFEGFLRMLDIKDKEGEISYNVNLFSEVLALADILKDLTFATLDFDELAHDYNYSEIRNSWQGILTVSPLPIDSYANNTGVAGATTTNVLRYPFIDWNHQFIVNATTGFPVLPNLETAFRPCIELKYLINKIFSAAGFSWTSNFFDTTDFGKLYMDFNWGNAPAPATFDNSASSDFPNFLSYAVGAHTVDFPFTSISSNFGYSAGVFTAQENNQIYNITYNLEIISAAGGPFAMTFEWIDSTGGVYNFQSLSPVLVGGGVSVISGSFSTPPLTAGDTLSCRITAIGGVVTLYENQTDVCIATTSVDNITDDTLLQTLRGELGQWDFLKGIFTMFDLVSLVDENDPTNILIEPYSDVFINNTNCSTTTSGLTLACRSIEHDWTDKVDVSEMELKPLTDLNATTTFKFAEDDDDYVFNMYKQSKSGHLYGSKVLEALTSAAGLPTILQGNEEISAEPFAATVSKPLSDIFTDFIVPSIYAVNDEGTSEGFDNSPRILYNNGVQTLTSSTYNVPAQNGSAGDAFEDEFLQFSHLSQIPTTTSTTDFVFQSEQLFDPLGAAPVDNLYNTYWAPYFNELYNADTRIMTLKVNLSPSDVATFKFYDVVFIKNRTFRVNKIDYKPNDLATVEFILIP